MALRLSILVRDVHEPAHTHVKGNGPHTRIGQNGKPLKGQTQLSTQQKKVVKKHLKTIRKEMRKLGRANKHNQDNGF